MILVEAKPQSTFFFSKDAITYAWEQLALRVGIDELEIKDEAIFIKGIPLFYQPSDSILYQGKKVIISPCKSENWYLLLHKDKNSIDWIKPKDIFPKFDEIPYTSDIPVIFWGNNKYENIVEYRQDGTLIFNVDILATIFFMLSRWEEYVSREVDLHDRFSASASVAYKQGFLDTPIVDVYALIFREWLKFLLPDWKPAPLNLKINITHDIDWIMRFSNPRQFLYAFGKQLIKNISLTRLLREIKNLFVQIFSLADSDYLKAIYELAKLSEIYNLKSKFYFMATTPSVYQQGYDPASNLIQKCIKEIKERGHEIGLHPGYYTFDNFQELLTEKEKLEVALGEKISVSRQHYLRFKIPITWRFLEQAGILDDSTLGYADEVGFRCGTCYSYHPFDIETGRVMSIMETPLIVMDTTLRIYRKFTPDQSKTKIFELAGKCRAVGGTFTILWHNTSFFEEWQGWKDMYSEILLELSKMTNFEYKHS